MGSEWKVVATGSSEGWSYTVEIQKLNGKFFTRIKPGSHAFRLLDGSFDDQEQAVAAAKPAAEAAIREIRGEEGYPPA